jgi:tRNA(Ile)-lysidine synthase
MDPVAFRSQVERFVRRHDLLRPGGDVTCLVSGGADSTCLWHVLRELGFRVSAAHVNHGVRGEESEADVRFCREVLGAEVIHAAGDLQGKSEAELRDVRYTLTGSFGLRATGHTASDNVETLLYRVVSSGRPGGIKPRREDGIVRPLLRVWREETEAYCRAVGLPFRVDTSNVDTKRGLIRQEILPLLERLDPRARPNLLALAEEQGEPRLPRTIERTLLDLLSSTAGTKEADLGGGVRAVREYDRVSLERGPVRFGPWTIESDLPGLEVRTWQPGDRLAGRSRKVQDVFTDAKVPRRERAEWPVVVRDDEVVAIPGIVETPGVRARREQT